MTLPIKIVAVAAVALASLTPAAFAQTTTGVRIVSQHEFGLDAQRAAAVAGAPVEHASVAAIDQSMLSDALDARGYDRDEIESVYVDGSGIYWVFVDRES